VKRNALLPLLASALVFLGACGVTTGDEVSSGTDATTTTTTAAPGGDDAGDEGDETTSPAEDAPETTEADDTTTTTEGGGGDTTDTTGFEMGDEVMRDALIQGFTSIGLTTEQATCLADGYIELGLTDVNASPDVMQLMDLFSQCGVSLEELGNLGAGLGAGTA
jgi:hypothetical protein